MTNRKPLSTQAETLAGVLLATLIWSSSAPVKLGHAQAPLSPSLSVPSVATATLNATRLDSQLRLDGRIDEAAWSSAPVASGFTQSYPQPGAEPSQRTEAWVLYDDRYFYVAVRAHDTAPDLIAAPLARRDATDLNSDWIHLIVDSRFDRTTAFRFSVNPRGVQRDVFTFDDGAEDGGWDAVWEVATTVDEGGWSAEFRIPLSQLRFGGGVDGARTWGFQIMRDIARTGERASWSPWTRNDSGFVSRFGTLTGLVGIRPPRGLELAPYTTARLTRAPGNPDNPFYDEYDPGVDIGGDLRLGLPKGLTLSATINPDFGQVEADPAEVNLTVFETQFTERRPFFTEGVDIFRFGETRKFNSFGLQQYFYSRRIGRAPQLQLSGPEYLFVDRPAQSRILGAAKVSGRTPAGWTIGILEAITQRSVARYTDGPSPIREAAVEPLSNYLVGRVRRDFRQGETILGGIFTSTVRDLDSPALEASLNSRAFAGGLDFLHTWGNRTWSFSGYLAASRIEGSPQAIAIAQRSSGRYYQRPDVENVRFDPTLTSLSGTFGELALQRSGTWDASLQLKQASPGFEMNDLGFHGRVDYRSVATFLGQRINEPRGPFRNVNYSAYTFHAWNYAGDRIIDGGASNVNGSFRNFWNFNLTLGLRPSYTTDRLTRGGPLALVTSQHNVQWSLGTDPRRSLSVTADGNYRRESGGSRDRVIGMNFEVRPSPAVRLRFGPRITHNQITQYVATVPDAAADATFGGRYLFADLDQKTFSMDTRVDWTFTPTLSLQLYAQPFVSAGSFRGYKEFRAPGTFDFDVYGRDRGAVCVFASAVIVNPTQTASCPAAAPSQANTDFPIRFRNPDFEVRSLRGNAVVRWEYRPGSALFLVWQQERAIRTAEADFDLAGDLGKMFREPATNVLLIKASYWLGG